MQNSLLLESTRRAARALVRLAAMGAVSFGVLSAWPTSLAAQAATLDAEVEAALEEISPERLLRTVQRLESFGTRFTMSDTLSDTQGIGAARRWIFEELQSYSPRLEVSFDSYLIHPQGRVSEDVILRNVMAVLPGRTERRVYLSGHYDSVARQESGSFDWADANHSAPGANDDASGVAATMEAARVLAQSGIEFDATLVFIAFAGEEMGLVGARAHVQRVLEDSVSVVAVLNSDIMGNSVSGSGREDSRTIRIFSEDPMDSPARNLARYIRAVGGAYTPSLEVRLIAREDRFGRGGDHTAFTQQGFAGVRFSEAMENLERQHTLEDTSDGVDPEYLARAVRLKAATAASLALAPDAPQIRRRGQPMLGRGESNYGASLRWDPAAGAVSYRIVWRRTWNHEWEHSLVVGDRTEFTLEDISIDDYTFGITAIGPDGHESLVSSYTRSPRRDIRLEMQIIR